MYRQGNLGTMQGRPRTNGLYSPGVMQNQRLGGNPMMAQNQQNPYGSSATMSSQSMVQNPAMRGQSPMRGPYPSQPPMHRPGGRNPFEYGQRSKYYMNVGPGKTWGYCY